MLVEIVPPTESQSGVAGFCVAKMATVCFNGRDSATLSEGPSVSRSGVAVFHVDRTDTEQGDPLKGILRLKIIMLLNFRNTHQSTIQMF